MIDRQYLEVTKKFLKENSYILPIYAILLAFVLLSDAKVSLVESTITFVGLAIANVFFAIATLSFSKGNEQEGLRSSFLATVLYFFLGLQGFVSYGIFHFMSITPFVYGPFYYLAYKGLYNKGDSFYFKLLGCYIIANIAYVVATGRFGIAVLSAIVGMALGAYAVVKADKSVSHYSGIVIVAQILIIFGSAIGMVQSVMTKTPISGLTLAFMVFPLVIIIPLLKEKFRSNTASM